MKKFMLCILIIILCCSLNSCSDEVRYGLTKDDLTKEKRYAIEVIEKDEEELNEDDYSNVEKIIYCGEEYFPCEAEIFISDAFDNLDELVLLSWNGTTLMGYAYTGFFFADTEQDPLVIYLLSPMKLCQTYIKKDYNYQEDTFFIEGTNCEALFSDFFNPSIHAFTLPQEATDVTEITLRAKTSPALTFSLKIYKIDDEWYSDAPIYSALLYPKNVTLLSNELVQKLKTHNIIA